jgi:hypothetical protein
MEPALARTLSPAHSTHTHTHTHTCAHTPSVHVTLWWRSRKGSSISMPPSCTIHQTSMLPSEKRSGFPGNMETFLVTSRARWPAVVSRTSSGGGQKVYQRGNGGSGPLST